MNKSWLLSRPSPMVSLGGVVFAASLTACVCADRVMLLSGETMEVTNLSVTDTSVRFEHPVLGDVQLTRDQVRGYEVRSTPKGRFEADAALGALQDEAAAEPQAAPEWTGSVTAALTGTSGNSQSFGFVGIVKAKRETDRMITKLDAGYFLSTSDGDRSENRFTIGGVNDWLIKDSPWSIFADARYDNDEFQSWDARLTGHGGVGYQLVDKENYKTKLRAGIGFIKEFGSANDDVRPEALFGVEGEWKISEKQSLAYDATIYPDLDDTGEFRTIENLAWKLELDAATNMSLAAGLQHEYQSKVAAGQDRNDVRVFVGLNFSF